MDNKNKMLSWLKTQYQKGDCFWILRGGDNDILEISEIDQIGLTQDQADNLFNWDNDDSCRSNKITERSNYRQGGLDFGDNELVKINLDNPSDKEIFLYCIAYTITNNRKTGETKWSIDKKDFSINRHMDYGCGKLYSINRNPDQDGFYEQMVWRLNEDEDSNERPYKDYYLDWCRREGKELPEGDIGYCEMTDWLLPALWKDDKEHPDYAIQEELYEKVADDCDELWLDQSIYTETMDDEDWEINIEGSIQLEEPSKGDLIKLDHELYVLLGNDGEGFWEAVQPSLDKVSLELIPASYSFGREIAGDIFYWKIA